MPALSKPSETAFSGNQMHPITMVQSPPNQLNCFVLEWIVLNLRLHAATAIYYRYKTRPTEQRQTDPARLSQYIVDSREPLSLIPWQVRGE